MSYEKAVITAKHYANCTAPIKSRRVQELERRVQRIKREVWRKLNRKGIRLTPPNQIQQVTGSLSPELVDIRCMLAIETDIPFEDLALLH